MNTLPVAVRFLEKSSSNSGTVNRLSGGDNGDVVIKHILL